MNNFFVVIAIIVGVVAAIYYHAYYIEPASELDMVENNVSMSDSSAKIAAYFEEYRKTFWYQSLADHDVVKMKEIVDNDTLDTATRNRARYLLASYLVYLPQSREEAIDLLLAVYNNPIATDLDRAYMLELVTNLFANLAFDTSEELDADLLLRTFGPEGFSVVAQLPDDVDSLLAMAAQKAMMYDREEKLIIAPALAALHLDRSQEERRQELILLTETRLKNQLENPGWSLVDNYNPFFSLSYTFLSQVHLEEIFRQDDSELYFINNTVEKGLQVNENYRQFQSASVSSAKLVLHRALAQAYIADSLSEQQLAQIQSDFDEYVYVENMITPLMREYIQELYKRSAGYKTGFDRLAITEPRLAELLK